MSDDVLVTFRSVRKIYSKLAAEPPVLDGIDLTIRNGEFLAIMGPSGSGKTTLLNLVGGLDKPTSGEITVDGIRIDQLSRGKLANWRAANIGFIFQFYNLMPTLVAAENIELPLLLTNLSRDARKRKVAAALELVGLENRARHRPSELSGGQQQRVAIARAIVTDPRLLLCDEPTGNLDRASSSDIMGMLKTISGDFGRTIILVTHDAEAARFAQHSLFLDKGLFMGRHAA
jgi:putative ABC transport system ATP-binding protein